MTLCIFCELSSNYRLMCVYFMFLVILVSVFKNWLVACL